VIRGGEDEREERAEDQAAEGELFGFHGPQSYTQVAVREGCEQPAAANEDRDWRPLTTLPARTGRSQRRHVLSCAPTPAALRWRPSPRFLGAYPNTRQGLEGRLMPVLALGATPEEELLAVSGDGSLIKYARTVLAELTPSCAWAAHAHPYY
jgi:hypothetical protein